MGEGNVMQTEIVLPETKPETEWVRGRALQKVSPTYRHARLQSLMLIALDAWADGRGRVGTEWRFRVAPPGEVVRPLVPDVAYLAYERLAPEADDEAQVPLGAPSVAVEILSPDDRKPDVRDKIATYLRAGTDAVIVVDPKTETVRAESREGVRTFRIGDNFLHASLPGFSLNVLEYFARARK
ncbi:MAG: Uma2 family endonuclease [Candidatus Velthaea sp.]